MRASKAAMLSSNCSIVRRCCSSRNRRCSRTQPVRTCTSSARVQPRRSWPSAASFSASVSPAIMAFNMRRPLAPMMSVITEHSLMFASSRTAWMRCTCCTISRVNCFRVRVRSRKSWIAGGGTKLDWIRPCAIRSASQVASFTSLLRPGTFFTCAAFARISANRPSRMCQTGFQYTPVASIATCVHPALSSHSASANNPCVVVGKRRTSRSTLRLLIRRRQATTSTLCTSRPAHRLCNVFIATSLGRGRREALAHRILPTVFQDLRSQLGQPHPLTTITGARRASGQTHSRARSHQATPTSVPTAPHPNPFHPSGCARAHANSFDHLVGAGEQGRWEFEAECPGGRKIDYELEPGRLHDRQVGAFCAFENSAGVNAGLTIRIRNDSSVAHQAAGRSEFAPFIDRRQCMACGQHDELLTPDIEECSDQERRGPLLDKGRKRGIKIAFHIGAHDNELHPQAGSRLLHLAQLVFGTRIVWVDQHGDDRGPGNHFVQQSESLRFRPCRELIDPGQVATGPVEARDEPGCGGIVADSEDDRNCPRRLPCGERPSVAGHKQHGYLGANQIGRERRKSIELTLGKAVFDGHVLAFDVAGFLEALQERGYLLAQRSARPGAQESDHRHHRLLRPHRHRPRSGATEQRDELAPPHSMTSSAVANSVAGTSRPSAFAVLRLITNSYLVGACTGRSAGFLPLRMRST